MRMLTNSHVRAYTLSCNQAQTLVAKTISQPMSGKDLSEGFLRQLLHTGVAPQLLLTATRFQPLKKS